MKTMTKKILEAIKKNWFRWGHSRFKQDKYGDWNRI